MPRTTTRRKELGLCTRCGLKPLTTKTRCGECSTRHVADSKTRYKSLLSSGVCPNCGLSALEPDRKSCRQCLLNRQLSDLRNDGLNDSEIQRAKKAAENFDGICQACGRKNACGLWCLDHCHTTLIFRGIVGRNCNLALGNSHDSPEVLRSLALYVERTICPEV